VRRAATTLVLAATLLGCSELSDAPAGPTVTVAEGRADGVAWMFDVYRTSDGWCESIVFESRGSSGGCSQGPDPDPAPGSVSFGQASGTGLPTLTYGRTGENVAAIRIATRHDGDVEVQTIEAPVELDTASRFFVAVLPEASTVQSVATLDGDGTVMETLDTGISP
jgi:hypothetical protein